MTQQEFVDAYKDEMTGLLLASFTATEPPSTFSAAGLGTEGEERMRRYGRFFVAQQRRAIALLKRMYVSVAGEKETAVVLPSRNGSPVTQKEKT